MSIAASTKTFIKNLLPSRLVYKIQSLLFLIATHRIRGFNIHLNLPDRRVLEDIIIPYFISRNEFYKILFIGCDWYTKPYSRYFRSKDYWTIEIDNNKSKYGAKNHISDSIENLSDYIDSNYFDLVVFTGVFGHGLNSIEVMEEAINQCFQCLREGGILVFGWNDIPELTPFPVIQKCQNLNKFTPYFFAPLSSSQYLVNDDLRHTFVFYIKPLSK